MIHPPKIEHNTRFVEITCALPCNVSRRGEPLGHPLPQESEIRQKMIEFAHDIRKLHENVE